ncbi:MAG: pseudouridine synthase [Candidatus Omnitrophota bacterium]|jgi:pseudouridine synthase
MKKRDKRRKQPSNNLIRTISKSGYCSRKEALRLVQANAVKINGKPALDPGRKMNPSDRITVNGRPLAKKEARYIIMNKPSGYVTTREDELGRPTVYEFLKDVKGWVFPVGRLDLDSEGLLIFTNDTKLGSILTEPRYEVERTYEVLIDGTLGCEDITAILKGVDIGRGQTSRAKHIKILGSRDGSTLVEITLTEGKNREIRRLFESFGSSVKSLKRIRFGPFKLGNLKPGKWIEVTDITEKVKNLVI